MDERELVERAKKDPEALGILFDRHYEAVLNYAARRTSDAALAHDIAAETFCRALKGIRTFQWRGIPFSAWLYRIAANEIAAHYRGRRRLESLERLVDERRFDPASDEDLEAELIEAQDALDRHKQYQACMSALRRLPHKYQEVIALRFFEEKSIAEIGQITGRPQGTVKSLLHRGLKRLHQDSKEFNVKERNLPQAAAFTRQED